MLLSLVVETLPQLQALSEEAFSAKPNPEKWSKKEILGHLIDSAANNHQRFIRAQFESDLHLVYAQNEWVAFNKYQEMPTAHIIEFWATYNKHLAWWIENATDQNLQATCSTDTLHSIEFLVQDYIKHQKYHLNQILG